MTTPSPIETWRCNPTRTERGQLIFATYTETVSFNRDHYHGRGYVEATNLPVNARYCDQVPGGEVTLIGNPDITI